MPLKTHVDEAPALNLTPLIDVLFLLIIFFMTGAKFTEMERKIRLQLPQVPADGQLPPVSDRIAVNVFRDGSLKLNNEPVTVEQLAERLRSASVRNPAVSVIVRGDAEVPFQSVANVLAACRKAGVTDMGVTVRLAATPGEKNR